jgi:hypothetical protein
VTPANVRRTIESLSKRREMLSSALNAAEARADAQNEIVRTLRKRLSAVILELNEAMPK